MGTGVILYSIRFLSMDHRTQCISEVPPIPAAGSPSFGYKRVYLPLGEVTDTPFDIQGDEICRGIPPPE